MGESLISPDSQEQRDFWAAVGEDDEECLLHGGKPLLLVEVFPGIP